MTYRLIGPRCASQDCSRPLFKAGMCAACWRLSQMHGPPVDPLERLYALPTKGVKHEQA